MNKKHYLIIGIIILITISGIILIRNCGQGEPSVSQFAKAPVVIVEATVTSLYLDDLRNYCEEPEVCPRDRVNLRIDEIDRTDDPNNAIELNINDEIEFHLKYSARPAKLRNDILPTCSSGWILESGSCVREGCEGPECVVSSPNYEKTPAELEDGYIIYHLPQRTDNITETILPGLNENSKIKITIWQPTLMNNEIGDYKVISSNAICVQEKGIAGIDSNEFCCQNLVKIQGGNGETEFTCVSPNIKGAIVSIDSQNLELNVEILDSDRWNSGEVIKIIATDQTPPIFFVTDYTVEPIENKDFESLEAGDTIEAFVETAVMGNYVHGINIILD